MRSFARTVAVVVVVIVVVSYLHARWWHAAKRPGLQDGASMPENAGAPYTMPDPATLTTTLGLGAVTAVARREQTKEGGMSSDFAFLDVTLATGEVVGVVHKTASRDAEGRLPAQRVALGTAREALFYIHLAPQLPGNTVPRCYHAAGDMATGEMSAFLECLADSIPAGSCFGPGNPNNWAAQKRGALSVMASGCPTAEELTEAAFELYAKLHATYWRDASLLAPDMAWLRGAAWHRGEDRASWAAALDMSVTGWRQVKAALTGGHGDGHTAAVAVTDINWCPHLVACLDASFGKVNWEAYTAELERRPFTLVHGDAHPHNVLRCGKGTPAACLRLIDFEMVGVGSGAQDLGQFMISHMTPKRRRACEHGAVAAYHTTLVAELRRRGHVAAADAYTLDDCWTEYVAGGAGRWAWFIPFFRTSPAPMAQFFHDQLAAFLKDHMTDPAASPMPRV